MVYPAGAVAAAAAAMQAIKTSCAFVRVQPEDFLSVLQKSKESLVITGTGGVFSTIYQYMTNYKGFTFFTTSKSKLSLPNDIELIRCKTFWVPQ